VKATEEVLLEDGKCMEGKAAIVTGSGRGIGRAVAKLLAAEGAKVVVNDLGAATTGEGADAGPAQAVVDEIHADGGEAIANNDSVASWDGAQHLIAQAIAAFGRIDCVINNAGVLRDAIFHKMTEPEWRSVVDVSLFGAFNVSRAAAPHFRDQQSGAFVHMTSTAGLIGNFGQANYMAAKLGVVGLSRSIALDMARFNVRSNALAPFAWSRLIGTIPTETDAERERVRKLQQMTPETVAPMVVFLCSDAAREVSGQVFCVRKHELFLMSQPRPIRSAHDPSGWTPAGIAARVLPAFRASFVPMERSGDVFSWDPM
jgi:NAD(P)-dependent dehydrogenase (short-subunit alcohol dehydrogenase family)